MVLLRAYENQKSKMKHTYSSVFIATFSRYEKGKRLPTNGFVEPLLSFFIPKVKKIVLLDAPHPVSDTINPIVEEYAKGKFRKKYMLSKFLYFPIYVFCKFPSKKTTRVSYKLRDFFSTLYVALTNEETYDVFIGLEGVYALSGILLKRLGKVKTVVYYVSDYAPNRFGATLLNKLYLWLDQFCVRHADFTWDVSPAILQARLKAGLDPKIAHKVLHVPNALFPSQIAVLPFSKRIPNSLVYMGILDTDQGADFAIQAMLKVIKKIPDATLHIIGGTKKDVEKLKILVKALTLEKHVIFYGFITDNSEMARLVRRCMIGLAPYRSFPDSFRWYGDAGKIRQYMASGLPVVTTHVPPLGKYITENGAALMRKDTLKDFSEGILTLLSDKKLYKKLADSAQNLGKENTWENTYAQALLKMETAHD